MYSMCKVSTITLTLMFISVELVVHCSSGGGCSHNVMVVVNSVVHVAVG